MCGDEKWIREEVMYSSSSGTVCILKGKLNLDLVHYLIKIINIQFVLSKKCHVWFQNAEHLIRQYSHMQLFLV